MNGNRKAGKIVMIIFFGSQRFFHQNDVPQGQMITANYYKSALTTMLRHFRKNRSEGNTKEVLKVVEAQCKEFAEDGLKFVF